MPGSAMKSEAESSPRFEFRTFGKNFTEAVQRMRLLSVPVPEKVKERYSEEIYLVSEKNDISNIKIRDRKIDIKTLVQCINGLEQWQPLFKADFPVTREILEKQIFPAFQTIMPVYINAQYSMNGFVDMISNQPGIQAIDVHKHRFGYVVNGTICEVASVIINGVRVSTISSESTEVDDIKKTIIELGLSDVENINYTQAIKRIIGMVKKPLAN